MTILCEYLVREHREPGLRWAMAARSEAKLKSLADRLGDQAEEIPQLQADAADSEALRGLCGRASLIISTVGPYALYGEPLLAQCAQTGTDYCDLTGEPQWIRRMLDKYGDTARGSGARIVNCCGFDSIPSDLGVRFLQEQARQRFGSDCQRVKMRVKASKGGASGGTIASGLNVYREAARDPELRRQLQDPYYLCPDGHGFSTRQHNVRMEYDEDFKAWAGPFIMAAINTKIVLRSNALRNPPYHPDFLYDEATLTGGGSTGRRRARRLATVTRLGGVAIAVPPLRWLLSRFLPKPGEGPSPQAQEEGFYDLRFHGRTEAGGEIRVRVTGDRDPGYGSTAKMLSQAAISLATEVTREQCPGGFWTPATAFDERLTRRLQAHAGMTFEVLEASRDPE